MESNKNKKSVKFQGDMLNFCDFIQVFLFTTNHHLNRAALTTRPRRLSPPTPVFTCPSYASTVHPYPLFICDDIALPTHLLSTSFLPRLGVRLVLLYCCLDLPASIIVNYIVLVRHVQKPDVASVFVSLTLLFTYMTNSHTDIFE